MANIKNAASPIVAVKTATKEPKPILPWIYCVTRIFGPRHPGRSPRIAAIVTLIFLVLIRKEAISNFVKLSMPIKINNVKPTKTETCNRHQSLIV